MRNKTFLILATIGLAFNLMSCTSGEEKSDVEAVQGDVENLSDGTDAASDDALLSDQLPEEALGADGTAAAPADPGTSPETLEGAPATDPAASTDSTVAAGDEAIDPSLDIGDETSTSTEPPSMVADSGTETTSEAPPALDTTTPPDTSMSTASTEAPAEPKPSFPLQKVPDKPRKSGDTWLNGVYFARPGDNLKKISKAIYGEEKAEVLKAANPTYKNRQPKPGDKVYYNSPKRPNDGETMMNFYEENSVAPEVYVTKDGDNLRTVAKSLLGYDGAWKEVWASNSVESKDALPAGTELRYWKSAPMAAPATEQIAQTPPPPPPTDSFPPPPPPDMAAANPPTNDLPPPPPPMPDQSQAMNDLPPPPPPQDASQAMNDIPPPPPVDNIAPPPPPPPTSNEQGAEVAASGTELDQDTMMALGVVGIAFAGIAGLLVVRKKRRQKEMENHIGVG